MISLGTRTYTDKFKFLADVDALSEYDYNTFVNDLEKYLNINNRSLFLNFVVYNVGNFRTFYNSTQLDKVCIKGTIIINSKEVEVMFVTDIKLIFDAYVNGIYEYILNHLSMRLINYIKDQTFYNIRHFEYPVIFIKSFNDETI